MILQEAVAASTSFSGVLNKLSKPINGKYNKWLRKQIEIMQLDTSHFTCMVNIRI